MERSLVIIKPNAVKKNVVGAIIDRFEKADFSIIGMKMVQLNKDEAENFYYVHRGQEYFEPLVNFMISDKCVPLVIEGNDIIMKIRSFIGPTNPADAEKGTIRADFGDTLRENAVHASDGLESSKFEVNFFFPELTL